MFKTFIARLAAAFYGSLVPTEDRLSARFARLQGDLAQAKDNAEAALAAERRVRDDSVARQQAAATREMARRAASFNRSDRAYATLERASRVGGRIEQLFA
jgi:hypothetical protein